MIKIIELFVGIGAFSEAMKKVFGQLEVVNAIDNDKHALNAYNAINGTNFEPQDINEIDMTNYEEVDYIMAGWPCQDFSNAGKGLGLEGNRSSLILTTIEKINEMKNKPKYIILENVKGLLNKKHEKDLEYIKNEFINMGYQWSQRLFNAKNFSIPQNRERIYFLLTRKDLPYIKLENIKLNNNYKSIKDIMENKVDENLHEIVKTHITKDKKILFAINNMSQYKGKIIKINIKKLKEQEKGKINYVAELGTIENNDFKLVNGIQKRNFLGIDGISKTLRSGDCDTENKILFHKIKFNQDKDFIGINGVSNTLISNNGNYKSKVLFWDGDYPIRYRKLSSLECWRLMGFPDEAHNKVQKLGTSHSRMTKLAGNSIVINVLISIIEKTLKEKNGK